MLKVRNCKLQDENNSLQEEKTSLQTENNLFYKSTTILINLKQVMAAEKNLIYQLAELQKQPKDPEHDSKKAKIEERISKCRENIGEMEVQLKKVHDCI